MSVYYNDLDPFCCKVLEKNIRAGHLPEGDVDGRDIRAVRASELMGYQHIHLFAGIGAFPLAFERAGVPRSLRIITGGFPCQDISQAGRRVGITGERSGLWSQMVRLLQEMLDRDMGPDYLCIENVAALLGRGLSRVLADLAACGYDAEWQCLRASDFGAPHRRERLFLLAYPQECRQRVPSHEALPQLHQGDAWMGIGGSRVRQHLCLSDQNMADAQCPQWGEISQSRGDEPNGDDPGGQEAPGRSAACREEMADAHGLASGLWGRSDGQAWAQVGCGGEERLADSAIEGLSISRSTGLPTGSEEARTGMEPEPQRCHARQAQSSLGRNLDGSSDWLDGYRWPAGPGEPQEKWEPPRTITGRQPHRIAQLRALGNAIVVACAQAMAYWILEREYAKENR